MSTLYICRTQEQSDTLLSHEMRGCGHIWRDESHPQTCPCCEQVFVNEITADRAVYAHLAQAGIQYWVAYVGETERWETKSDEWRCTFAKLPRYYTFNFYTGLGNRAPPKRPPDGGRPPKRNTLMWEELEKARKPVTPTPASVLYCLLSDARAIDQSFDDWCGEFGGNPDSIRELRTYEACCEVGRKLKLLFTPAQRETLALILEDY